MPKDRTPPRSSRRLGAKRPRLNFARATAAVRAANVRLTAEKTNRLSARVREALLRQTPLLVRGVWKVSGDAVQPWFKLVDPKTKTTRPEDEAFQAWARTHMLQAKVRDALVDGHLHGDGFAEFEWGDAAPSIEDVAEAVPLLDVHGVDPSTVDLDLREDGRYDLVQRVFADTVRLHPDRYHAFPNRTLRGFVHGLSSVEVAYHVAMGAVKGDQSIGEILRRAGVPREHWTIHDAEQGDIDELTAMVQDPLFERGIVTGDDTKSQVNNPSGMDPTPLHGWVKLSIAAVLGIPVMMLEGAQAGQVSGSETNIEQYRQDLGLVQRLNLNSGLGRIINGVTGLTTLDYEIQWNPFPIGDAAKAIIARDRASAFNLYLGATRGGKRLTLEAAARLAGVDLRPEDLEDAGPVPDGLLSPGAAVDDADQDAPEPEAAAPTQRGVNGRRGAE